MKRKNHYRFTAGALAVLLSLRCFAAYATETLDLDDPLFGQAEEGTTAWAASDFADALPDSPSDSLPFALPEEPLPELTYGNGTSYADEGTPAEAFDPYYEENADIYAALSASDTENGTAYFDENADIYRAVDFALEGGSAESESFLYAGDGTAEAGSGEAAGETAAYGSSGDNTYDLVIASDQSSETSWDAASIQGTAYTEEYASQAAFETEEDSDTGTEEMHFTDQSSGTFVNPLYEYLDLDVGLDSFAAETPSYAQDGFTADTPKYGDIASAASYVRKCMKKRDTVIQYLFTDIYTGPGYVDSDIDATVKSTLLRALDHTGNPTEGDYLFYQFSSASYTSSYLTDGLSYTAQITLNIYYYTNASEEAAVTKRVASVLSGLDLNGKSTYAKVKAIYDYICSHVRYDYAHLNDRNYLHQYTAYGALIDGTAVCQGYAVLMYRMLLESGIDCRVIQGVGGTNGYTERHAWNIIKVGSLYYCADATWDSPDDGSAVTHNYFLRGNTGTLFPGHYPDDQYVTASFLMNYPHSLSDCSKTNTSASAGSSSGTGTGAGSSGKNTAATRIATKSISTPKTAYTVKKGKTVSIKATVKPSNSSDSITYSSANKKIATVSKTGKVKGIKKGTTTVTIKSGAVKKTVFFASTFCKNCRMFLRKLQLHFS